MATETGLAEAAVTLISLEHLKSAATSWARRAPKLLGFYVYLILRSRLEIRAFVDVRLYTDFDAPSCRMHNVITFKLPR